MADNRKLYKEAVSVFGHSVQTDRAIKEASSLIVEIQKHKLMTTCNIPLAIADLEIMLSQLRLIFPGVPEVKKERLVRLQELIRARKELRKEN